MLLTQIDPPLCSLLHLSLSIFLLVIVNTQPRFPLCPKLFFFSQRCQGAKNQSSLKWNNVSAQTSVLLCSLPNSPHQSNGHYGKAKRDCRYCTCVCVHLCAYEVIGTLLNLFCRDRWREKFRTRPQQSLAQWWFPNRTQDHSLPGTSAISSAF